MIVRILVGDALTRLRELDDGSVNCCVTSPPYFGLRNYGAEGQIGLEPTPEAYIGKLVEVFSEVRRVLRDDGTLWCVIGDSYARDAAKGQHKPGEAGKQAYIYDRGGGRASAQVNLLSKGGGLKEKDLIGIPWMLAFAMRDAGWYLRQDIIWSKPNPLPESVRDRCTKAHEFIFLFSKNALYYYDCDSIKEMAAYPDGPNSPQSIDSPYGQGFTRRARAAGNKSRKYVDQYESEDTETHRTKAGLMKVADVAYEKRNKRSVWTVASFPFPDAHFSTFPPALIEPCILAGCPAGGTVLDPFAGAGTTGLVADRLGRDAILIEINPQYAEMARRRIAKEDGIFSSVSVG